MIRNKFTSRYYFVQSTEKGKDTPSILGHSKDDETGEIYYKFLDRSKANKLMKDEKEVTPELQYRVVKITETFEAGPWQ